ncbi:3-hydroxyacyl-ACP dehydratase [Flavitalea sp. BT771]|uniref:3-hydroxyacyl-ACP dehydratase n=1 Tax=Flavitalea sp. BT771 TaxID=3063329 RepID=UPI0026E1CDC9|nr:3-hydroxyacyl-ACP dehydratase [Flavitalea sp. BT771]MDO6429980.1 3-hydroxyacyl-ACP dehydratase [Flavitalea sp. BT771]MDV6217892.1 3-hydroxyacyl-ACP dehydratase [Flavitalea sp. BT771]
MLKDSFYTILEMTSEASSLKASLQLHEDHQIYQGHFPGQPVVPGVCLMEMVKELTALAMKKTLELQKADNIKFLQPIDPHDTPILQAEISYRFPDVGVIRVSGIFLKDTTPCFKFSGIFRSVE